MSRNNFKTDLSLVIQLSTVESLKTQVSLWRILWCIFRKKEIMHCSSKIFDTAFTGIISLEILYYVREDGSDTSRFILCLNYLLATSQCRKVLVSASYMNTQPTSPNKILLGEISTQLADTINRCLWKPNIWHSWSWPELIYFVVLSQHLFLSSERDNDTCIIIVLGAEVQVWISLNTKKQ
jgi:hypothetical protein